MAGTSAAFAHQAPINRGVGLQPGRALPHQPEAQALKKQQLGGPLGVKVAAEVELALVGERSARAHGQGTRA